MLERIAKYIESYDVYSFMDAYENIDECVKDLQTYTHKELLEMLKDMNDGSVYYWVLMEEVSKC